MTDSDFALGECADMIREATARCSVAEAFMAPIRDVLGLAFAATLNAPMPERAQVGVFRI
ncbi:hypothetical protein FHS31_000065 [Sphingomonas vulcanisoli]|uniref:DUF4089 domain-containing protein n=1 Tax=Sphingomonas vulcanisoli TaxID=1658060 RepID=A0ABX0TN02_9SPHN|nr:hypothetical protein [Sphingomonas vulcanisoli]NIJ06483.1 hypothetical protein [Sphingomonas vulcanisoli]